MRQSPIEVGAVAPWPPLRLEVLGGASGDGEAVLLQEPVVARDARGDPVFSLTLLLERDPRAGEPNIAPLVMGAVLAMEVQLSAPGAVRDTASRESGRPLQPLFVRGGEVALEARREAGTDALASMPWSGTTVRGGLSASLRRDEALEALQALDGVHGERLHVRYDASFHENRPESAITVSGYYAEVFDAMAARFDGGATLQAIELEQAFGDAMSRGLVDVALPDGGKPSTPPTAAAFRGFLRVSWPVLQRIEGGFRLRTTRPHSVMRFEFEERAADAVLARKAGSVPLWQLLAGLLGDRPRDPFVRFTLPDGESPRRATASRGWKPDRSRMAMQGEAAVSMATAMRPTLQPLSAAKIAHTDLVRLDAQRIHATGRINLFSVDDAVADANAAPLPGPIVEKADAPLWRDRVEPRRFWYAPAFSAVIPAGNADPASSPFLFDVRRVGTDAAGQPALEGTVRISVSLSMPPATKAALDAAGGRDAATLPMGGLAATLSVPYLDSQTNARRRATFQGSVVRNGDTLTATFMLLNSSLRMAYGALSGVEPQAEAPRLEIAYTYAGYVPAEEARLDAVFDGKHAILAMSGSRAEAMREGSRGYSDAGTAVFDVPGGEVRFRREAAGAPARARPPAAAIAHAGGVMTAAPTAVLAHPAVVAHPIIARPQLMGTAALAQLLRKVEYVRRSMLRQEAIDLAYPCASLGAFYREEREGLPQAIGCTQSIRLGQAVVRQYEEIATLAAPGFRVLRSLQQPGRFLVLPAAYRITRYSPSIPGKGWRPAVAAFTVLDAENDENNRILFQATLQPDIALATRRELADQLAQLARDPVVEYPTEIAAEVAYAWLVGAAARVEVETLLLPDAFQVSLATDLAGALLLKSMIQDTGVSGTATFRLPDGTSLTTLLAFELGTIVGPWTTGPLEIMAAGTSATLRNAIERPVDVADLLAYGAGAPPQRLPVESTLQPGASRTMPIPAGTKELYAVATPAAGSPAAIEEIRSFVEEVSTNAVFIDLVNRDNHGLLRLDVEARMQDVPGGARPVPMAGDPPTGSLEWVLPITTYLGKHVVQFRVRKTFRPVGDAAAVSRFTRWFDWDLEAAGAVVSLTWDLVGEGD